MPCRLPGLGRLWLRGLIGLVVLAQLLVACGAAATTTPDAATKSIGAAATATTALTPTTVPTATPTTTPTTIPTPTSTPTPLPVPTVTPTPLPSPTATRPLPTPTRPAPTPTSTGLRPVAPIPAGWKTYSGTTVPVAIAYPPDWTVEEDRDFVKFRAPNGTAVFQVVIIDEVTTAPTAEQARDDFWAGLRESACTKATVLGEGEDVISGLAFAELIARCDTERGERTVYLAAALGSAMTWGITASDLVAEFDQNADQFFDPMLKTLNLGVKRAGAAPSPRPQPTPTVAQPTPTKAAASATAAANLQPTAPIPAGWRTYRSTVNNFAIAYPPDWQVDDTNQGQGVVNFLAPDGQTTLQVRSAGTMTASLGIERLRDIYSEELTKRCGNPAQAAGYNSFSGIRFAAILVTPCTANGKTLDLYYGTGIRNGEEWTISFTAPQGRYTEYVRLYFGPLVDTLNIATP